MAESRICIEVETSYLDHQSDPAHGRYAFAYSITIRNEGSTAARLLSRHWIITDADGGVQEVQGEGVVGEQPLIRPGEGYRYSSGAIIPTPVGSMRGAYQMVDDAGQHFEAPISAFTLARPGMLH